MNWRFGIGVGLAVIAAAIGWSTWTHRAGDAAVPAASSARPDYVMHDYEMVALNKQGAESVTLRGPLLERSALDHTASLTTPLFLIPDNNGDHWQLRSKTGWLSADANELRLRDDVVGTSPDGIGTPTTLTTTQLNVYPQKDLASTPAQVVVTQPGSILSGVGFETNMKTRHFVFKTQVKSRYAPKRR